MAHSSLAYEQFARVDNGHTDAIAALSFSPKGTYLATAGLDSKLCVWRVTDQTIYHTYAPGSPVLSVCWMPGREDRLVCGMQDGAISTLTLSPVSGSSVITMPVLSTDHQLLQSGRTRSN